MKVTFNKPIPKYILAKIHKLDLLHCPQQKGAPRFYSYLTRIKNDLAKITVAVKNFNLKQWHCKQVAVHFVGSNTFLVKDLEYCYIGYGYRVGWHAEGLSKHKKWFEDGNWYEGNGNYYNPLTYPINRAYIDKFAQYRYSAHQHYTGRCVIQYLKLYKQYPQTEYLLKLDLHKLHDSIIVLKRIAKDKTFCRWLIAHKTEIATSYCYIASIVQAYKTGKPIAHIQSLNEKKKRLVSDVRLKSIQKLFKGKSLEQFFAYLDVQQTSPASYRDYLDACKYLNLDMTLSKNLFPHNFKHWHDMRIDQFHAAKAIADEKERLKFYAEFDTVAKKYRALQKTKARDFVVVIAKNPSELLHEGKQLNHCVGKMNYDQKFVRQETLIFFVRDITAQNVPFVTVEYSIKSKKILQYYGLNSKKPDEHVLHYVHNVWLPYANKHLKKIQLKELAA